MDKEDYKKAKLVMNELGEIEKEHENVQVLFWSARDHGLSLGVGRDRVMVNDSEVIEMILNSIDNAYTEKMKSLEKRMEEI